jgi:hypothetical protein
MLAKLCQSFLLSVIFEDLDGLDYDIPIFGSLKS